MTDPVSTYAGRYQGPVWAVPGYRLLAGGGTLVVRDAGTETAASLYKDAGYATPMVADPIPASAGLNLAGLDAAGTLTFYADSLDETYDIAVRYAGGVGAPLRVHVVPDAREAAAEAFVTGAELDAADSGGADGGSGVPPATPFTTTVMDNPISGEGSMTVILTAEDDPILAFAREGDVFPRLIWDATAGTMWCGDGTESPVSSNTKVDIDPTRVFIRGGSAKLAVGSDVGRGAGLDTEVSGDITWADSAVHGPVLTDRTTSGYYRLFVDNGVLSVEAVV